MNKGSVPEVLPRGHVSRLRTNWSVFEDGALAERLQSEEISDHLSSNRRRNHQIRDDIPVAHEEQSRELETACRQSEERRRILHEQEAHDEEIARHIQQRLLFHHPHPNNPPPLPSGTPPLPCTANGDVPTSTTSDVLPNRRVVYNDDQYLVKLARPALVTAEPVYANNKPEHYAVSSKYPNSNSSNGGAIAKTPTAKPRTTNCENDEAVEDDSGFVLSQRDVVMAQRAEEMLEQQKRDEELAKRLQQELSLEEDEDARLAREAQDREYAKMLHQREKAKLKRAKERARQKKLAAAASSTLDDDGDSVVSATPHHAQPLPARRPIMNRGAIDSHQSEFAAAVEATEEEEEDGDDDDIQEPQYANVGTAAAEGTGLHELQMQGGARKVDDEGMPIPPYMPMQQQTSRKSSSLEKRIKKKKEKEGCKQQ